MKISTPSDNILQQRIYNDASQFDFLKIAYGFLLEKADVAGYLPYHITYEYLGRRLTFKKLIIKDLLTAMQYAGYLKKGKRGIFLK